jgi:hypothetical protein
MNCLNYIIAPKSPKITVGARYSLPKGKVGIRKSSPRRRIIRIPDRMILRKIITPRFTLGHSYYTISRLIE